MYGLVHEECKRSTLYFNETSNALVKNKTYLHLWANELQLSVEQNGKSNHEGRMVSELAGLLGVPYLSIFSLC